MSETQFHIWVAVMPVTTIIIVLIGVLVNNSNMNNRMNDVMARLSDLCNDVPGRLSDLRNDFGHRLDRVESKIDLLTGKVIELVYRFQNTIAIQPIVV